METKPESQYTYEDGDDWRGSSEGLGIKEISLRNFSKAMLEGSKEMVGAGVEKKLINGVIYEIPRPNQREVFINSVEMAYVPLRPKLEKSKKKKMFEDFDNTLKKLDNAFESRIQKLRLELDKEKPKVNNHIQEAVKQRYNAMIHTYNQTFSDYKEDYEIEKVKVYKELLIAISFLLNELDYFDEVGING